MDFLDKYTKILAITWAFLPLHMYIIQLQFALLVVKTALSFQKIQLNKYWGLFLHLKLAGKFC